MAAGEVAMRRGGGGGGGRCIDDQSAFSTPHVAEPVRSGWRGQREH